MDILSSHYYPYTYIPRRNGEITGYENWFMAAQVVYRLFNDINSVIDDNRFNEGPKDDYISKQYWDWLSYGQNFSWYREMSIRYSKEKRCSKENFYFTRLRPQFRELCIFGNHELDLEPETTDQVEQLFFKRILYPMIDLYHEFEVKDEDYNPTRAG